LWETALQAQKPGLWTKPDWAILLPAKIFAAASAAVTARARIVYALINTAVKIAIDFIHRSDKAVAPDSRKSHRADER
jgi:hypothetical protein